MKKYVRLHKNDLIFITSFLDQCARLYHRAWIPATPYSEKLYITKEEWSHNLKEGWKEFLEYYDSSLEPTIVQVFSIFTRCENKVFKLPIACSFIIFCTSWFFKSRQYIYVPVRLIDECKLCLQKFIEQVEEISCFPDMVTPMDKNTIRYNMAIISYLLKKYPWSASGISRELCSYPIIVPSYSYPKAVPPQENAELNGQTDS